MFFELRQYQIKPGRRAEWVQFMDKVVIPYQRSKGMVVVGSWTGETDENLYIWMRRFESEAEREQLYAAVYEDDQWLKVLKPKVDELLDREKGVIVTRLEPTPRSIIR